MTVEKVYLPANFSMDTEFGAGGWDTEVVRLKSGKDQRVSFTVIPLRSFTLSYNALTKADVDAIVALFEDREGMLKPFLAKDFTNYLLEDELILTATGGEGTAQIQQSIGLGNPLTRTIRHIDNATLVVKKNGTTMTLASEYSVSAAGLLTFVSPLNAADEITVSCEFFTPVTFETDDISRSIVVPGGDVQRMKSIQLREYSE